MANQSCHVKSADPRDPPAPTKLFGRLSTKLFMHLARAKQRLALLGYR
jgi:hypothetical protein